jgi:lysophospholipid acyltransferase
MEKECVCNYVSLHQQLTCEGTNHLRVSMFYLIGLFDLWTGLRTILISAGGAYAISSQIHSPYMPWIGFVFLMGHMSVNHIYRQAVNDASAFDITGAQMVLVMKLTAFCWNVQDGRLPDAELTDFQKEHAIRTMPSILDYIGYVFFFPAMMAGPAFDYADYSQYITTTMFTLPPGTDPSKAPPTRKKRKIPRSGTPATIKGVYGTLWLIAFIKFSTWYYPAFFLDEDYMQYNFFRRMWQLYMLGLTVRMKYYAVWSLSEGSCILSGIGYNGIDPKTNRPKWDRLTNIKPLEIESAQNARAYLGFWNINTNNWLRNYMYLRVTPKGQKPGFRATLATFVTSAFWHGFYPGYYLSFVLAAFVQTAAKSKSIMILRYITLTSYRWSPPRPTSLHDTRWQIASTNEDILRRLHSADHPNLLCLRRRALHPSRLLRHHQSMGTRLLLHAHRRRPILRSLFALVTLP